jgi:hypothetical protein
MLGDVLTSPHVSETWGNGWSLMVVKRKSDRSKVKVEASVPASKISFVLPLEKKEQNKHAVLLCVGLIIMILAVYMQVGTHQFLNFDDDVYVTNNPHVASGLTLQRYLSIMVL